MDPIQLAALLQWLALVPKAIPIVLEVIGEVKAIIDAGGTVTQEKIDELVAKAEANHARLSVPE